MRSLKDIFINRMDVVDKGDNKNANIILFKNEGGQPNVSSADNHDLNKKGVKKMTYEELIKELPEENAQLIQEKLDAEVAKVTELEKKVEELEKKQSQNTVEKPEDDVDDIIKSADPKVAEVIKKLQTSMEDLKKNADIQAEELKKSREAVRKAEFIKIAEPLNKMSTNAEELGTILMEVEEKVSKENYDKLMGILKAANEAVEKGEVLKEVGTNQEGAGVTESFKQLEAEAQKLAVEKGTTKEIEFRNLIKSKPELYQKYEDEKGV